MAERDYTFRKLQRFILENSAQANGVEMKLALDERDDAVNGRLCSARHSHSPDSN